MNTLDKNKIEKEIQELQNKDTDESKQQILIANAKIESFHVIFLNLFMNQLLIWLIM